jgi:predicted nucleic acid-binding protein
MSAMVVDASVGLALVRREPAEARARAVLAERAGAPIIAPSIFWLEVINVLARRYGYSGASVLEAVHELDELQVETIEADRSAVIGMIDLVERHGLSAYDAAYLALAEAVDAQLATADRQLAVAAGERAVYIGSDPAIAEERARYRPREATWPLWHDAGAYLAILRASAEGSIR